MVSSRGHRPVSYPGRVSTSLGTLQDLVVLALALAAFVLQLFALFDALRQRRDAFPAAGKQTKRLWVILLVIAAAVGFASLLGGPLGPLNLLNIVAVVIAGVYLADVRPAVRGGTGQSSYGSW